MTAEVKKAQGEESREKIEEHGLCSGLLAVGQLAALRI
jgi:hypothetical protein